MEFHSGAESSSHSVNHSFIPNVHLQISGAKRVRQLFAAAKAKAPCVLFIDEIDTCGAKRTSSQLHPYANQTINQLLAEMDGFNKSEGVVVLGRINCIQLQRKLLVEM